MMIPQRTSRALVALVALAILSTAGSCRPATLTTPESKRAYDANEVVKRINEFQSAVIDASDDKLIPEDKGRLIVGWTVKSLEALRGAPEGWRAVLYRSWARPDDPTQSIRAEVERLPKVGHWIFVFDMLLAAGAGGV